MPLTTCTDTDRRQMKAWRDNILHSPMDMDSKTLASFLLLSMAVTLSCLTVTVSFFEFPFLSRSYDFYIRQVMLTNIN